MSHPYGTPFTFYRSYRWHRGPSRIVWFIIGAVSATWYIKGKEAHRQGYGPWNGPWNHGHCVRPPIQPLPSPPTSDASPWTPRDIPRTLNNIPPAESWGGQPSQTEPWNQEEKERMAALTNQAGDKVSYRPRKTKFSYRLIFRWLNCRKLHWTQY